MKERGKRGGERCFEVDLVHHLLNADDSYANSRPIRHYNKNRANYRRNGRRSFVFIYPHVSNYLCVVVFGRFDGMRHGFPPSLLHRSVSAHGILRTIFDFRFSLKRFTFLRILLAVLVLSCLQSSSIRGLVASWTSLLHFLLSLVFFNRSSNGIPVHSSMLSIHRILGLRWMDNMEEFRRVQVF